MQFARDAHMAEGWMIAQEPYLKNENLGVSDSFFLPQFYGNVRGLNENLCGYSRPNRTVITAQEKINCRIFYKGSDTWVI